MKLFLAIVYDSYIFDVFEPYDGNNSDDNIMRDLFRSDAEVCSFFRGENVFLVNWDFRNVANLSEFLTIE